MKLTIITIAYNSGRDIGRTIESVLAQEQEKTPYTMEYLIIDGASNDDTVAIAESYAPAMESRGIEYRISSEPDNGIYDAMNKGISRATGDIIGILNSGDWYESNAAGTAVDTFASTGCDLMYANIRMHMTDGNTFIKPDCAGFRPPGTGITPLLLCGPNSINSIRFAVWVFMMITAFSCRCVDRGAIS